MTEGFGDLSIADCGRRHPGACTRWVHDGGPCFQPESPPPNPPVLAVGPGRVWAPDDGQPRHDDPRHGGWLRGKYVGQGYRLRRGPADRPRAARLSSRGESSRPRRLPTIQPPVKPPRDLEVIIPGEVQDWAAMGYGDRVESWVEDQIAPWRHRVDRYDPDARVETLVHMNEVRPDGSRRLTLRWTPGDTDTHATRTARPGTRIR